MPCTPRKRVLSLPPRSRVVRHLQGGFEAAGEPAAVWPADTGPPAPLARRGRQVRHQHHRQDHGQDGPARLRTCEQVVAVQAALRSYLAAWRKAATVTEMLEHARDDT